MVNLKKMAVYIEARNEVINAKATIQEEYGELLNKGIVNLEELAYLSQAELAESEIYGLKMLTIDDYLSGLSDMCLCNDTDSLFVVFENEGKLYERCIVCGSTYVSYEDFANPHCLEHSSDILDIRKYVEASSLEDVLEMIDNIIIELSDTMEEMPVEDLIEIVEEELKANLEKSRKRVKSE